MRRAKILFSVVFSSNFIAAAWSPVAAAPACLQAGEAQGFNIIGLKTTLMVDALSCGMGKNYDSFMIKFQSQVLDAQHQMDDYFVRAGGLAGQGLEDDFTTQLANSESDAAVAQGAGFCSQAAEQFTQVAGLGGAMDLISYAVKLNLAAPPGVSGVCPAAPPLVVADVAPPAAAPRLKGAPAKAVPRVASVSKLHPAKPAAKPASPYMVAQTI